MLGRMDDLFPLLGSAWGQPEERPRALREALEALDRGDPGPLLQGFLLYLVGVEGKTPGTARLRQGQAEAFLRHLRLMGRKGLRWEPGDFLRHREDLLRQGAAPHTLVSHQYGVLAFLRFLRWAGWEPSRLDFPPKERAAVRTQPLSREAFLDLLEAAATLPSRWREPLLAALVLAGEAGLRLDQILALTTEDLESASGRVRLPGGRVELSRRGAEALRRYLDWRASILRYPTRALLISPEGTPPRPHGLLHALKMLSRYAERPLTWTLLRLTGQAQLIRRFGAREASRLLRRFLG